MNRADALLAALRARAELIGASQIESAQVEALGGALEISVGELPMLVAQLQARTPPAIELVWGGGLRVLRPPPPSSGGGTTINAQGATFGHGAALAGNQAQGGTVTIGTDANSAIGVLANVIADLAALRPTLQGEAANAATQAEQVLRERPAPDAPVAMRKSWAEQAGGWFSALLKAAPQAKALVEMGEKAVTLLS